MIESFRNKDLSNLWSGKRTKIDTRLHARILVRLEALDAATVAEDMNLPGYDFHMLRGHVPTRYTVHVNGPWCITFAFEGENAQAVDFENYH